MFFAYWNHTRATENVSYFMFEYTTHTSLSSSAGLSVLRGVQGSSISRCFMRDGVICWWLLPVTDESPDLDAYSAHSCSLPRTCAAPDCRRALCFLHLAATHPRCRYYQRDGDIISRLRGVGCCSESSRPSHGNSRNRAELCGLPRRVLLLLSLFVVVVWWWWLGRRASMLAKFAWQWG